MQDKLIVNHTFNGFVKEVDLEKAKTGDVLFYFNEHEPISIKLESENFNVQLECISYRKDDKYYWCEDNVLTLCNLNQYIISQNNSIDVCYCPSRYQIIISNNLETKVCYFDVRYNKNMPEEGMNNIIERINSFINGLSIDFFRKSPINNILSEELNSSFYIYELLKTNSMRIIELTNKILNNCRNKIVGSVSVEYIEKKQNLKTIRKNILSKPNNQYYNVKKIIDYNTPENVLLKKYLLKIISCVKQANLDLDYLLSEKNSKLLFLQEKKLHSQLDYKNKSRFDRNIIDNQVKSIESEIEQCLRWIDKINSWIKSYNSCLNAMLMFVNSDEFININTDNQISYSQFFYGNPDYYYFKKLYDLLSNRLNNVHIKNKSQLFADKKSYNIFEIYGFIILQNIFKELGFEIQTTDLDIFSFSSDMKFLFINDNFTIEVVYDHYCEKYDVSNNDRVVNINSRNCKPDYIVKFYENDELKNVTIFEIKYRNLKYMVDNFGGTTETDSTLDDYAQLGYKNKNGKIDRNKIKNVVLLYPSISEKCFVRNMAEYIGINAEKDFIDSIGYQKLKSIIIESLFN